MFWSIQPSLTFKAKKKEKLNLNLNIFNLLGSTKVEVIYLRQKIECKNVKLQFVKNKNDESEEDEEGEAKKGDKIVVIG